MMPLEKIQKKQNLRNFTCSPCDTFLLQVTVTHGYAVAPSVSSDYGMNLRTAVRNPEGAIWLYLLRNVHTVSAAFLCAQSAIQPCHIYTRSNGLTASMRACKVHIPVGAGCARDMSTPL